MEAFTFFSVMNRGQFQEEQGMEILDGAMARA